MKHYSQSRFCFASLEIFSLYVFRKSITLAYYKVNFLATYCETFYLVAVAMQYWQDVILQETTTRRCHS